MSFEDNIKQWVKADNQITILGEKMKELKTVKKTLENDINIHVDTTNLNNAVVQLNDGQLKFQNFKSTQPLTLKFVEECLAQVIESKDDVQKIMECIKENRSHKLIPIIKRTYK